MRGVNKGTYAKVTTRDNNILKTLKVATKLGDYVSIRMLLAELQHNKEK